MSTAQYQQQQMEQQQLLQKQYDLIVEQFTKLQKSYKDEEKKYQTCCTKLSSIAVPRQQYELQLSENEAVSNELNILDSDTNVFKSVGPVLIKQDLGEARENVNKRLEYIRSEINRLNSQYETIEKERDTAKSEINTVGGKLLEKKGEIDSILAKAKGQGAQSAQN